MVTTKFEVASTLAELSQDTENLFEEKPTSLTPEEEEKEAEREDVAVLALIRLSQTHPKQHNKRMKADESQLHNKRMKADEIQPREAIIAGQAVKRQRERRKQDNSEETLRIMVEWNEIKPEKPPFVRDLNAVGVCSEPVRKQLTKSDVLNDQCRLMLGKKEVKKMMLHVLGHSGRVGTNGIEVLVHGPDGEVHTMVFKMWADTPVLAGVGWKKFVGGYGLEMNSDFLTIWMFKHSETQQICFAIDVTRFPVQYPLSSTIKAALQN
ncbi:unnamed protein product [Thlaspi arvense]|uniref:TF-B3 domain-containing protein n=1 Tax=Thlaspi arvense TaxID=13288 RepID=A0AAU9SAQ0_THLAR|nr:unnamed protein product [Thlaspi arvense]